MEIIETNRRRKKVKKGEKKASCSKSFLYSFFWPRDRGCNGAVKREDIDAPPRTIPANSTWHTETTYMYTPRRERSVRMHRRLTQCIAMQRVHARTRRWRGRGRTRPGQRGNHETHTRYSGKMLEEKKKNEYRVACLLQSCMERQGEERCEPWGGGTTTRRTVDIAAGNSNRLKAKQRYWDRVTGGPIAMWLLSSRVLSRHGIY